MDVVQKETFASLPVPEQIARLARTNAKTRRELLLSARNSLDLARSLSPELLFYTIKEIGLADSVDLLALAAPEQVRDMVDLDCWRKDQFDDRRMLTWLMLLDEAGSGKLAEWFLHTDVEILVVLVKRHLEVVRKADVEEEPDFDQTKYFTFDDHYLLRFNGDEEPILALLLERLRVLDYEAYKTVLEDSLFELESGLEEEALRWRNARLAERGYPAYEEAREVFRFLLPESVRFERYRRSQTRLTYAPGDEKVVAPDHALALLDAADSFLLRTLVVLPPEDHEQIGHELAYLTNQIVIAEACDAGEVTEVRRCVQLAHDYLNIGLAFQAHGAEDEAARLLQEVALRPFFQIGVSLTLRLQQGVRQIDADLRRARLPEWETYLDSPFRETCVGLQRRLPLFFRGLETPGEILYRRFQVLADVKQVEALLSQLPHWFTVMQQLELIPEGSAPEGVTLGVLWNTAFAGWVLERKVEVQPLSRSELSVLQERLRVTTVEEETAAFLQGVTAQLKLTMDEADAMRVLTKYAQGKLEDVLAIEAATADLRFIEGVLVRDSMELEDQEIPSG
jgi:hypothetical protein